MRKLKYYSLLLLLSFCFSTIQAQSEEYGMASYYGDEFDGSATASGEAYDKNKLTAGHKTLPLGSKVRVTRLDNKKSVVVRIIDRGPYLKGRIIDLSGRAASALDMIADGTAEIKLEVVGKNTAKKPKPTTVSKPVIPKSEIPVPIKRPTVTETSKPRATIPEKTKPKPAISEPVVITPKVKPKEKKKATAKPVNQVIDEAPEFKLVTGKDYNEYDLYKIQITRPEKKGFGVQVGVFSDYSNTMKMVAELQGKWFKNILVSTEKGTGGKKKYRIILGPFPDSATATSYKNHAKKKQKVSGFVVNLEEIKAAKK